MFSSDFPHYDADEADAVLRGLSPELTARLRYQNALASYPRLRGLAR
jgi:hypothetical protein